MAHAKYIALIILFFAFSILIFIFEPQFKDYLSEPSDRLLSTENPIAKNAVPPQEKTCETLLPFMSATGSKILFANLNLYFRGTSTPKIEALVDHWIKSCQIEQDKKSIYNIDVDILIDESANQSSIPLVLLQISIFEKNTNNKISEFGINLSSK